MLEVVDCVGQCSIELPTRLELTTIAVNTLLHLERLLDL